MTNNRPKPLLPILGRPCVEYTLRALGAAGVQRVYLACGFKSMEVVKAIGDGKRLGIDLIFAFEEEPMGTAGAVKLLEKKLPDTFVVVMGDVLVDIDFETSFASAQPSGGHIALTEAEKPEQLGIVGFGSRRPISRFKEKPVNQKRSSNPHQRRSTCQQKDVFQYVPEDTKFDFSKNLFLS
jgi:mannose-1-phosphate guanylyltransferase